jgi:hypothetical protein
MKKIGFLYGIEQTFSQSVMERINNHNVKGVSAELMKVGSTRMDDILKYNVILDRVSHEVSFYRSILKLAYLNGVNIVNNPFWACADDNFFHAALAEKINVNVPKTIILPSKEHPPGTNSDTMRNLVFPIEWDSVFEYIGFPAYIKPNLLNSFHDSYKVYNPQEFFSAYDLTGNKPMLLQESIEYDTYYKCFVIGRKHVRVMTYNPIKPHHQRYISLEWGLDKDIVSQLAELSLMICETFGFDFNAIEFAVKDNIPYAVEFLNPAATAELSILHEKNFNWVVENTASFLIEKALERKKLPSAVKWHDFLLGAKPEPKPQVKKKRQVRKKRIKK